MERLGSGLHATVYKARRLSDGLVVAIKENNPRFRWDVLDEAQIMQQHQHPNLRKFIDCFDEPDGNAYIVMELLRSSVWQYFQSRDGPWREADFRKIISDAAHGLHFLHSQNVRHGDLHYGNIMVDLSGGGKIADFTFVSPLAYFSRRSETLRICNLALYFATGDMNASPYDDIGSVKARASPELKEFFEKCYDKNSSPSTAKLLVTAFVSYAALSTTTTTEIPRVSRRLNDDPCWASCMYHLTSWERVQKCFTSDMHFHDDFVAVEQCVRNNSTGFCATVGANSLVPRASQLFVPREYDVDGDIARFGLWIDLARIAFYRFRRFRHCYNNCLRRTTFECYESNACQVDITDSARYNDAIDACTAQQVGIHSRLIKACMCLLTQGRALHLAGRCALFANKLLMKGL